MRFWRCGTVRLVLIVSLNKVVPTKRTLLAKGVQLDSGDDRT